MIKRLESTYLERFAAIASYCTTGQFAMLGKGYVKHCGPTAVTNVIISLLNRSCSNGIINERPDIDYINRVFLKVTEIGRRKGIYWITDFLKMFGGTFDTFTKVFLHSCFKDFGLNDTETHRRRRATEKNFRKSLESGSICYLQLRFDIMWFVTDTVM